MFASLDMSCIKFDAIWKPFAQRLNADNIEPSIFKLLDGWSINLKCTKFDTQLYKF